MASKTSTAAATLHPGSIIVSVGDAGGRRAPIGGASIGLFKAAAAGGAKPGGLKNWEPGTLTPVQVRRTDVLGKAVFDAVEPGDYLVFYGHYPATDPKPVTVHAGCSESVCFEVGVEATVTTAFVGPDCQPSPCDRPRRGDRIDALVGFRNDRDPDLLKRIQVVPPVGGRATRGQPLAYSLPVRHAGSLALNTQLLFDARLGDAGIEAAEMALLDEFDVDEREPVPIGGGINVSMTRTETEPTSDLKLWGAIKLSTEGMAYDRFDAFMELLFCGKEGANARAGERKRYEQLLKRRFLPFTDTDAYRVMKAATEAFVMVNCGVIPTEDEALAAADIVADFRGWLDRRDLPRPGAARYAVQEDGVAMLPYLSIIRRKLPDVPIAAEPRGEDATDLEACDAFIREKLRNPCLLELIWSYWHEEAMQVQTMNAVTRRFQNVRGALDPDPLANLEVNPLRPLNNLLWGYIQDEQHRLTVARRNAEYDHHYGLRLEGRAVQGFRGADTCSKFVEAFHHLLRLCTEFYKQDDDTTVKADAFGVLNALKEVHLILSQGAHSQFGDLPATARIEMLMQQWLLARPEFREFLPTRVMVAYPEPWMDRVDAMKKLQGWTDTSVIHFHNLAVFGEQVLLAIRWGAWSTVFEPTQAFNFARFWRPQIQGYIHAYRAATGVELGAAAVAQQVDATLPSLLLQRRLAAQRRTA